MQAFLLIVVKVGPVGKHTFSKNLVKRQKLFGVVYFILIMSREKAVQFAKTCLANNVWPKVTSETVLVAIWSLLWLHAHVANETLRKAARKLKDFIIQSDVVH